MNLGKNKMEFGNKMKQEQSDRYMQKVNPGSISVFLFYTCPRSNVNLLSSLGIPHVRAVTHHSLRQWQGGGGGRR